MIVKPLCLCLWCALSHFNYICNINILNKIYITKEEACKMSDMFKPVDTTLPVKQGFWSRCKAFWLQDAEEFLNKEIKVVLTPKQQKIEDEINEFYYL